MRPGITGPWQVHGRSDIPFDDMVKLDYMYVASWTMREDLRLLVRTVGAVFHGRGAYSAARQNFANSGERGFSSRARPVGLHQLVDVAEVEPRAARGRSQLRQFADSRATASAAASPAPVRLAGAARARAPPAGAVPPRRVASSGRSSA